MVLVINSVYTGTDGNNYKVGGYDSYFGIVDIVSEATGEERMIHDEVFIKYYQPVERGEE